MQAHKRPIAIGADWRKSGAALKAGEANATRQSASSRPRQSNRCVAAGSRLCDNPHIHANCKLLDSF
ncbi:hypothetical protein C0Z16_24255 [Paraburkholderia rhynchosiae]|uniref:Uncharacterized protein n=1 Tax=Paraburkholderia rhynchosiae TaxID=487049 RepID=A0ABX4UZT9_9BURK|nr:hypothetical protein C0Z16_24255 [Paraburkholderia rhynchosiae]